MGNHDHAARSLCTQDRFFVPMQATFLYLGALHPGPRRALRKRVVTTSGAGPNWVATGSLVRALPNMGSGLEHSSVGRLFLLLGVLSLVLCLEHSTSLAAHAVVAR